jgi:hypothetical protein
MTGRSGPWLERVRDVMPSENRENPKAEFRTRRADHAFLQIPAPRGCQTVQKPSVPVRRDAECGISSDWLSAVAAMERGAK